MITVLDRIPAGNKKNNICQFNIPNNITTVEQLVQLLSSGVYADIFANNSTDPETAGVLEVGTPVNKTFFTRLTDYILGVKNVTFPVTNWEGSGPWTNTVSVIGMEEIMQPIVGYYVPDDVEDIEQYQDSCNYITKIETGDGFVKATCMTDLPEVDVVIMMKGA